MVFPTVLQNRCLPAFLLVATVGAITLCVCASITGSTGTQPGPDVGAGDGVPTTPAAQKALPDRHLVHLPKDAERQAGVTIETVQDRRQNYAVSLLAI